MGGFKQASVQMEQGEHPSTCYRTQTTFTTAQHSKPRNNKKTVAEKTLMHGHAKQTLKEMHMARKKRWCAAQYMLFIIPYLIDLIWSASKSRTEKKA